MPTIEELQDQINLLHETFEAKGTNSRGVTDVAGKKFDLPVDEEHKATVFGMGIIFKGVQQPHLRAFWSSTFGFFSCFFSVFAPAAIAPQLRKSKEEGGIALNGVQAANAQMAAVASTIIVRVLCGPMCDKFGARYTFIILLLAACPGIVGLMFIQDGEGLLACRLVIGIGLASFVTCQVWCSQMFAKSVVGVANATAGGWGNLGGGVTQLVMPFVMDAFLSATGNDVSRSWRLCFLVPLAMHLLASIFIMTGQDLPDGNYRALERSGIKQKTSGFAVAKIGFTNVNAWILLITYGLCFGVELTMNNKAVNYFYIFYAMPPRTASILGSCFGLMNLFARSWGGLLSDTMNKKYGMRGRIWAMWVCQTLEGAMCLIMGLITVGYPSPFGATTKVPGTFGITVGRDDLLYSFNSSVGMVKYCGSKQIATPEYGYLNYGTPEVKLVPVETNDAFIMVKDPDPVCLQNAAPLAATMVCMIFFSIFVQMAEGLHFGIVPYVSRPALGVVSGMVGAGGNFGGVMGSRFIVGPYARFDTGFIYLGIVIMSLSTIMFGIYFPQHGGMLFKAGGLGSYDPQLVKPPESMRGSDQLSYANHKKESDTSSTTPAEATA